MNVSINIHKYWKIILILSIIVLTVMFFIFNEKHNMAYITKSDENFEIIQNITNFEGLSYKVNILLSNEEFDNIIVPEDMSLYYFPEECPSYKEDTFLITKENDLDKYYIPEKNYLVLLNKQHTWTKKPDKIVMWKK
jgi:hypothetical protein